MATLLSGQQFDLRSQVTISTNYEMRTTFIRPSSYRVSGPESEEGITILVAICYIGTEATALLLSDN